MRNLPLITMAFALILGSMGCENDPDDVCRAVAAPGTYTGCNITDTSSYGCGDGERLSVVQTTNAANRQVTLNVCCRYDKGCTIRVR